MERSPKFPFLSSRVKQVSESITLKLNEKANILAESGHHVLNLTAGQLPFRPMAQFVERINSELNFLKSYQYGPVSGFSELRKKFIKYTEKARGITFAGNDADFDCVISNGAKHTIYNVLGATVDPGDEVIILAPYWVSYPEMIKCWGGVPVVVKGQSYDAFTPAIDDIDRVLSPRTRAIIINSPNNPAGIHYSKKWMSEFAALVKAHPQLIVISDEIYFHLNYFDPRPTYFYQENEELLYQTVIVDGISKFLAATGLRIGYCLAPKNLTQAMGKLQGQTTSGPNSLIQQALLSLDFDLIEEYLSPIKLHLRNNANIIREVFRVHGLGKCWYQSMSAFYFMIDFKQTPMFERFAEIPAADSVIRVGEVDHAAAICEELLDREGVAIVPGGDFGMPNTARLSLVLEEGPFTEALNRLGRFLATK